MFDRDFIDGRLRVRSSRSYETKWDGGERHVYSLFCGGCSSGGLIEILIGISMDSGLDAWIRACCRLAGGYYSIFNELIQSWLWSSTTIVIFRKNYGSRWNGTVKNFGKL